MGEVAEQPKKIDAKRGYHLYHDHTGKAKEIYLDRNDHGEVKLPLIRCEIPINGVACQCAYETKRGLVSHYKRKFGGHRKPNEPPPSIPDPFNATLSGWYFACDNCAKVFDTADEWKSHHNPANPRHCDGTPGRQPPFWSPLRRQSVAEKRERKNAKNAAQQAKRADAKKRPFVVGRAAAPPLLPISDSSSNSADELSEEDPPFKFSKNDPASDEASNVTTLVEPEREPAEMEAAAAPEQPDPPSPELGTVREPATMTEKDIQQNIDFQQRVLQTMRLPPLPSVAYLCNAIRADSQGSDGAVQRTKTICRRFVNDIQERVFLFRALQKEDQRRAFKFDDITPWITDHITKLERSSERIQQMIAAICIRENNLIALFLQDVASDVL